MDTQKPSREAAPVVEPRAVSQLVAPSYYSIPTPGASRITHVNEEMLEEYSEQTKGFTSSDMGKRAADLDTTVRKLSPFVFPGFRGREYDYRGVPAVERVMGVRRGRFNTADRHNKLQLKHQYATAIRCRGADSPYALYLKSILDRWDAAQPAQVPTEFDMPAVRP